MASRAVDFRKEQPAVLHTMPSPTARNLVRSSSRSASSLVLITKKGSSLADDDDADDGVTRLQMVLTTPWPAPSDIDTF